MTRDISNSDDIIDSRDVIARIEELEDELESEREAIQDQIDELETEIEDLDPEAADFEDETERLEDEIKTLKAELEEAGSDDAEELAALKSLAEEGEQCSSDWTHGETLVREDYFPEYVEQLAEDIGAIDRNASWPLNHIDWEAAADDLLHDYSSVEFNGVTYYIRSS